MQNKINLDTHNELITVGEPWHRGSGFTWMLLALAGVVFFLTGAVAKAGDIWDGYVRVNGTWYNVGGANNAQYNHSTGGAQDSVRGTFGSANFGTAYYGNFGIGGFSVLGWTHHGESVGNGGANYKLWKSGTSEPNYSNYFNVNGNPNYAFSSNNYNQNSTSQTTQLIGADWINGDTYNFKTETYTTIAGTAKTYTASTTVTIGGARQLVNSSSDLTANTYYNTSAAGGVVKQGTGTLTLAANNSNAGMGQKGDIYIDAGTVAINPTSGVTGNDALGGASTVVRLGAETGSATAGFSLTDADGGLEVGRQVVVRSGSSGAKTISSANSSGVNTLSGTITLDSNVSISGASGTGIFDLTGKFEDGATTAGTFGATISAGTVRLAGNQSNTGVSQFTVANGATLRLNKTGADAVQDNLTINSGGTAQLDANHQLGASAQVSNSGILNVGAHSDTLGTLNNNSGGTINGTGTLTASTYNLSGGTVHANLGTGTMNVTGDTTVHGNSTATTVAISGSGTDLTFRGTLNAGNVTLAAGSKLILTNAYNSFGTALTHSVTSVGEAGYQNGGEIDLGLNVLRVTGADTGTKYQNSIAGGGEVRMEGSGTTALELYGTQSYTGATRVSGGKIRATTALASSAIEVTGGSFETTTGDVIGNASSLTLSGGGVSIGGSDTVGALTASGGRLTIASNSVVSVAANSSVSHTAEIVGGTLQVNSGTTLTLNSDDSDNTSAITIASGGTLSGSGTTTGALSVTGKLAPGNSTGILDVGNTSFLGGGTYQWEIDNFTGSVGTSWDLLDITGDLTISANSGSQFIIEVKSLLASNDTAGWALNFNDATNYTFAIATASGSISGYASDAFSINTAGFQNSFTGTWGTSLSNDGKSLNITYSATAIPEPSSASMLVLGLAALLANRRRCRR